ncbi:helix-turn-helix transcriptional regulator [Arenibaculum sp.]|uniref:helix-turn-helix transcriptional regulator n=1 Tax=Arenibaculum sp. TaxID=2865862 RepID=UPI002E129889|nr:WYL domain-containing protein [Arenibaculum sp.]
MSSGRLLSILLLLQTRGRLTARALADEVEVSVRTIYRDIDQLSAAGVPVYAEKGHNGGFQLLEGYRTRLTGLDTREAEALFLAGLPGPAAELGLGEAMAQARLKLLAALPEATRSDAERIGSRFHLDPVGWFRKAEQVEMLPTLALAVWTGRSVRMRYESWKGEVERDTDPLGLVLKAGFWYLVARVGEQVRTYRVGGILDMEVGERVFERPAGFDLAAHWAHFANDYENRMRQDRAVLRASPGALRALERTDGIAARAVRSAGPPDPQGRRIVELPIESIDGAVSDLIRLGDEVEILAPAQLRHAITTVVAALARRYGLAP